MKKIITSLISFALVAGAAFAVTHQLKDEGSQTQGKKSKIDFVLVETPKYSMEIPVDWKMGDETPWGAIDITPKDGKGKLGAMTAGPTKASWVELFETSMYFIKREEPGTPTELRVGKSKQGYETASFEVVNRDGFASRRFTLIRGSNGSVLALSVRIPSRSEEVKFVEILRHMVDTAKLKS